MTRKEMLEAKKARLEKNTFSGKIWTIENDQEITLKEYCEYINPAIKFDDIVSVSVIQKTCKEKKDKNGLLRTFKKMKIESNTNFVEFPFSFNGEDHGFEVGDVLNLETVVIKTEVNGDDTNDYVFGEVL